MAAAKKSAAKESPKPRKSEADRKSAVQETTRVITYLAPGQAPKVEHADALLDPKLAEIRDAEGKRNAEVKVEPRQEPTIDPELVKARDAQVKRETERAKNQK